MIRFKSGDLRGIPSGYDRTSGPMDTTIPPCGVEDVDVSVFELFDKEIKFEVGSTGVEEVKRVPIVFASGEKWASLKNSRTLRDSNGRIRLPLITIVRTSVDQDPAADICGRGINQQTGEIVIRRKLSSRDREYQNLINRLGIVNQSNVAVERGKNASRQISTDREVGTLTNDVGVLAGGLMVPDRLNNVWEIISIPSPQFFTSRYEVTFWTQYAKHMAQLIDMFFSSLLTPGNCFKLETKKGYWFLAFPDSTSFVSDTNFSNQAGQERIIKSKISMRVPGYIVAARSPGMPVPVRRTLSNPVIEFMVEPNISELSTDSTEDDPMLLGADDPTLPFEAKRLSARRDARSTVPITHQRSDLIDHGDPALRTDANGRPYRGRGKYVRRLVIDPTTGRPTERLVRLVSRTPQGEETYAAVSDSSGLTIDVKDRL